MILEYTFFQHYYIANKDTYESILCECLNKSEKMVDLAGGHFSRITDQSSKQPDIKANSSNYEIDFKMMISETLKEFQRLTAPIVQEIAPGVKSLHIPNPLEKKILLLWNCCRDMTNEKLQHLRTKKDMEAKAVTHFFDKVISTKKNILLFMPIYFSTVDKNLLPQEQHDAIFEEISSSTKFIYEFREKHFKGFDTFIIYVVHIQQTKEFYFVIAKFTLTGLEYIDKVPMFSLTSISTLKEENSFY